MSIKAIGASEIAAKVFPPPDPNMRSSFGDGLPTLRDVLPAALAQKTGSTFVNRLGKWLKTISTKRWGTMTLEAIDDTHNHRWTYKIKDATKGKTTRVFDDDDELQSNEVKVERGQPKREAPPIEEEDDPFKNNPYTPKVGISNGPEHQIIIERLPTSLDFTLATGNV